MKEASVLKQHLSQWNSQGFQIYQLSSVRKNADRHGQASGAFRVDRPSSRISNPMVVSELVRPSFHNLYTTDFYFLSLSSLCHLHFSKLSSLLSGLSPSSVSLAVPMMFLGPTFLDPAGVGFFNFSFEFKYMPLGIHPDQTATIQIRHRDLSGPPDRDNCHSTPIVLLNLNDFVFHSVPQQSDKSSQVCQLIQGSNRNCATIWR